MSHQDYMYVRYIAAALGTLNFSGVGTWGAREATDPPNISEGGPGPSNNQA